MAKDRIITTIRGDIPASDIGFCHSHEHLFIKNGQPKLMDPSLLLDEYEKTKAEAEMFKRMGGRTIVDAQPVGSGRDASLLLQLAEETDLHILSSTGFHKLGFYPEKHWILETSAEKLASLFIDELENGMFTDGENAWPTERIDARAGLIKTAADFTGTAGPYFRLFRAATLASHKTGAPIMSHTELGYGALDQIKLYTDWGIPEDWLIICHLDRKMENADYLLHVADTGVFVELDTIGRFKYHSDEDEVKLIRMLIDRGHEDQILLGLDTTRKRMKSYGGDIGLDHLQGTFLPLLRESGVTEEQIWKMMHVNPAKAFSKRY